MHGATVEITKIMFINCVNKETCSRTRRKVPRNTVWIPLYHCCSTNVSYLPVKRCSDVASACLLLLRFMVPWRECKVRRDLCRASFSRYLQKNSGRMRCLARKSSYSVRTASISCAFRAPSSYVSSGNSSMLATVMSSPAIGNRSVVPPQRIHWSSPISQLLLSISVLGIQSYKFWPFLDCCSLNRSCSWTENVDVFVISIAAF